MIQTVATTCQMLSLKGTILNFSASVAYSAPADPLAICNGYTCKLSNGKEATGGQGVSESRRIR